MENQFVKEGGSIQTSVLISSKFYQLCKQYSIKFSEAMRVGISILLAEKDLMEYDNRLNLHRKMKLYQEQVTELLKKIEELEIKKNAS